MAATVSGFLGFAISKVVDQFWTPTADCDIETMVDNSTSMTTETAPPPVELTQPIKPTQRKNANRNTRRKMQAAKTVTIELPIDVKPRSYSDPAELASNASTCGSSDDEEEVEDIGEKEMRLMLERAEQIKRLTKQSRQQQRQKESRKPQATKAKEEVTPEATEQFPDVCAPIRLQNKTHGLWNWSVYSGFAVDTKIANRGPRNMRHLYCMLGDVETLENEELLLDFAAHVLADN